MSRAVGLVCVLVIVVSGCFAPDLSTVDLLCDGEMRGCPPGYSCVEGHFLRAPIRGRFTEHVAVPRLLECVGEVLMVILAVRAV